MSKLGLKQVDAIVKDVKFSDLDIGELFQDAAYRDGSIKMKTEKEAEDQNVVDLADGDKYYFYRGYEKVLRVKGTLTWEYEND